MVAPNYSAQRQALAKQMASAASRPRHRAPEPEKPKRRRKTAA